MLGQKGKHPVGVEETGLVGNHGSLGDVGDSLALGVHDFLDLALAKDLRDDNIRVGGAKLVLELEFWRNVQEARYALSVGNKDIEAGHYLCQRYGRIRLPLLQVLHGVDHDGPVVLSALVDDLGKFSVSARHVVWVFLCLTTKLGFNG